MRGMDQMRGSGRWWNSLRECKLGDSRPSDSSREARTSVFNKYYFCGPILHLLKKIAKIVQSSHLPCTQFPLLFSMSIILWLQLMNQYWYHVIYSDFFSVYPMSYFCSKIPPRSHITLNCHVSLGSS